MYISRDQLLAMTQAERDKLFSEVDEDTEDLLYLLLHELLFEQTVEIPDRCVCDVLTAAC